MQLVLYSLLILIMVGCTSEHDPAQEQASHSTPIEIATVKKEVMPIQIETIGNIYSASIIEVRPQVGGVLLESYVEQGQIVSKGDLLYTIDPRPYQAAVDQAKATLKKDEAALTFAKKRVERYTDLVKKEYISKLTFDEYEKEAQIAEAQVQNDKANLAVAELNLEYCNIYSPIEGRISQFHIYPGSVISPNDQKSLTEIREISPICVHFTVPQRDLQQMKRLYCERDLKIQVTLPHEDGDGYDDDFYEGRIFFIDNHIDLNTGAILIKGKVENDDHMLWPGQFVLVKMIICEKTEALTVPAMAIQLGQKGSFVFVVDDQLVAHPQMVKLGKSIKDTVVIEEGLKEGDQVVITGQLNLCSGKKCRIASDGPPEEKPKQAALRELPVEVDKENFQGNLFTQNIDWELLFKEAP